MPKETSTTAHPELADLAARANLADESISIDLLATFETLVERLQEAARAVGAANARLNIAGPQAGVYLHTSCSHAEGRVVGLTEAIRIVVEAAAKANGAAENPNVWCQRCGTRFLVDGSMQCECAGDYPVHPDEEPEWAADHARRVATLRYDRTEATR